MPFWVVAILVLAVLVVTVVCFIIRVDRMEK